LNDYYKPYPSIIITIFLSGVGFLVIGEGINLEKTAENQNWFIIIFGLILLSVAIVFARSAMILAGYQSRLDASNSHASIPDEDIAKDIHERKGRFFKI